METKYLKVEYETETCCICNSGGELLTPEEHDAGAPPMQVPLRAMLLHLNATKVLPEGRFCTSCIRRAIESYEFSTALASKGTPPLSDKIRALRKKLHELTQKIDVFIVVGGGTGGTYAEEDIIMVERDTLAAAAAADDEDLEKARNACGDFVYQCTVCPLSFQRVSEYRAHCGTHSRSSLHSCWTCGAQFASRGAARAHAAAACGAALACQLCGKRATSATDLDNHAATCAPRCPACGWSGADRAALAAHAAAAHGRTAPPPHVCPACFRSLDSAALLSAHLLRHRQAKLFLCGYDACVMRFATRSNLLAHIRAAHGGDEHADTNTNTNTNTNTSTTNTTCDTCGRPFASVAAMKRHARVHRVSTNDPAPLIYQSDPQESQVGLDNVGGGEGEPEYLEMEELDDIMIFDNKPNQSTL